MKKIFFYILFLIHAIACREAAKETDAGTGDTAQNEVLTLTAAQASRANLTSGPMELKKLSRHLRVNGIIDVPPQNMITISFPPGGYLQSTRLLPGMHIRKGEVIATMQDSKLIQLQQDYLSARIRDNQLAADYRRQQELNRDKSSSDKALQEAEALWRSNKVLVKSLGEQLLLAGFDPQTLNEDNISRSVALRSPIDGFVASVKVNTGAYINPGDVLFELVDPDDIHLNLTVFEKDIQYLGIGQKVKAWSNTHPERYYQCDIILIGKELDEHRSVEVHCHFDKYNHDLLPGMFMNAEIEVEEQEVNVLPEEAVVNYRDRDYVFVDQGNYQYRLTEVKTGLKENGYVEVQLRDKQKPESGKYITRNAYTLLMQLMNTGEEE